MKKITNLRSFLAACMICVTMLGSKNAMAQDPVFLEEFNSITTGDNTTLTGSDTPWTANSNFSTAWRTFQAGGALRLGNGNDSSNLGYVTTNNIDLSVNGGLFTLSFDVKGWTTVENQIKVIITGQETQFVPYTATIDQDFETITLQFTNGQQNSNIIIETTEKRAFIDNILVFATPDGSILAAPVATAPTNITTTGFTANWGRVAGGAEYILDVSTSLEFDSYVDGYQNLVVNGSSQNVEGLTPDTQYFYRVKASNANATSVTSNVMGANTAVLGTNNFEKLGLVYYPNPVTNVLNVSAVQNLSSVSIHNIMGQNVISKALNVNNTQIDMANLSAGYYFLKVVSGNDSQIIKIIKQ